MKKLLILAFLLAGCISSAQEDAAQNKTSSDSSGGVISVGSDFNRCLDLCKSGAGSGEYCEDGCRFEQAENTQETSYCDQMDQEESIPECYGTVAIAAGDINVCNKLADTEDRNHCISTFSPR